jgi:hypothetical protein
MAGRSDIPWYEQTKEEYDSAISRAIGNTAYFLGVPLGYLAIKKAVESIKSSYVAHIQKEIERYQLKIAPPPPPNSNFPNRAVLSRARDLVWARRRTLVGKLISEVVREHSKETKALGEVPSYVAQINYERIYRESSRKLKRELERIEKQGLSRKGKQAIYDSELRSLDQALLSDASKNISLVDIFKSSRERDIDEIKINPSVTRFISVIERSGKFEVFKIEKAMDRSFILFVRDPQKPDEVAKIPVPSLDTNAANVNPFSARTAVTISYEDLKRKDVPITRQVITHGGIPKVLPSRVYLTGAGLPVEVNGTMQYLMDLERMAINARNTTDLSIKVNKYLNANLFDPTVGMQIKSMVVPVVFGPPETHPGEGDVRSVSISEPENITTKTRFYKKIEDRNIPRNIRRQAEKSGVFMDLDKIYMEILDRGIYPTKANAASVANTITKPRLPELTTESFRHLDAVWVKRLDEKYKKRKQRYADRPIETSVEIEYRKYGLSTISPASGIDSSDPYIVLHEQITNPDKSINYGAARNAEDYVMNKTADEVIGNIQVVRRRNNTISFILKSGKQHRISYSVSFDTEARAKSFDSYLSKKILKITMDHQGKPVSELYSNLSEVLAEIEANVQKRKGVIRKSNTEKVLEKISQMASDYGMTDMHVYAGVYRENVERVPGNILRKQLRSLQEKRIRIESYINQKQKGSRLRNIANKALQYINQEELEIKKQLSSIRSRKVSLIMDRPGQFDEWGRYKGNRQSLIDRKTEMIEELILPKKLANKAGIDLEGGIMLDHGNTKFTRQMELKNVTIRFITDENGKKSVHIETSKSGSHTIHTVTEEKEVNRLIKWIGKMQEVARKRAGVRYATASDREDFMKIGKIKIGDRVYDLVTGVHVYNGNIRTTINQTSNFKSSFASGTEYHAFLAYEEKSRAFKIGKGDSNIAKGIIVVHTRETIKDNPILRYFDTGRTSIVSAMAKLRELPRTRGNIAIGAFLKLSEETFEAMLKTAFNTSSIPLLVKNGLGGDKIRNLMLETMVNVAYSMNLVDRPVLKVMPQDKARMKAEYKEHIREWVRRNFNIRIDSNGTDRKVIIGVNDNVDMSKLHGQVEKNLPTIEFITGKRKPLKGGGYIIEKSKRLKYGLFDDYTSFLSKPIWLDNDWEENRMIIMEGLITRQMKLWGDIGKQITEETKGLLSTIKHLMTEEERKQLDKFKFEIGRRVEEAEIESSKRDRHDLLSSPSGYISEVFTATNQGPVLRVYNNHRTHTARTYTGNANLGVNIDLPNLFMMGINNPGFIKNLAHMMQTGNDWMVQYLTYSYKLFRRNEVYRNRISELQKKNNLLVSTRRLNKVLYGQSRTSSAGNNPFLDSRAYASSKDISVDASIAGARKYVKLKEQIENALQGKIPDEELLPRGFEVELEVDGEESLRRKIIEIRNHLDDLARKRYGIVRKSKKTNIYHLNLGKLILDSDTGKTIGKLIIPLMLDEEEISSIIRSIKGEQNTSTMIAAAAKGTNTGFTYQILGLLEVLGYIRNAKNVATDRKKKYITNTVNKLLGLVSEHVSRINVSAGSRQGDIYLNYYKRELYGSRFTITTNTANIAESGTALMTREYAQDFLIGDSRVASEVRRFQAADRIRRVLTRHFKEIHGLLPANIKNIGINNVDDLISHVTADELIELMKQIMANSTSSSPKLRKAIEGLRIMQDSTNYRDPIEWLIAHNKIWNDTNGYVRTIGSIYKAVRTRMANIMRGASEIVMAQRPPTHGPGDYIPLFMKIARPNIKEIVERQGGVMMNASDVAMAFGDIDGDIMNVISKGFQTIWSQNNSNSQIRSRIEELKETYMQRSYTISTHGEVRATNYMSEKAMRLILEHNGNSTIIFKKLKDIFLKNIKTIARETGKSVKDIIGYNLDILDDILQDKFYVVETVSDTTEKKPTQYKEIDVHDRYGNRFTTFRTYKNSPAGSYSILYETGRTSEETERLKREEIRIREAIKATNEAFGLEEEVYTRAMARTHRPAIQKEAAGTPYRTVLKLNHMFGYLQKVPFSPDGTTDNNIKFIKEALLKTGKFITNAGGTIPDGKLDADLVARDFANIVSDNILKPLAEQYALKAKHGILNIAEPVIELINKLSLNYFTKNENELVRKGPQGDRSSINKTIERILNVEGLYVTVDEESEKAVFSRDRISIGEYRDYMRNKFRNINKLIKQLGGEELKNFDREHGRLNRPEERLKIITDKLDKMKPEDINKIIDEIFTGKNTEGLIDVKKILLNEKYTGREKVIELLAARMASGEVVAGVKRMKYALKLNENLLHGIFAVSSALYRNTKHNSAITQFSETFDIIQDLVSKNGTLTLDKFIERIKQKGSKDALEYLTGGPLLGLKLFREGGKDPFGEYQSSNRLIDFDPLHWKAKEARLRLGGLIKGAAIGTLISVGIENLLKGSPVSEVEKGAGKGGEYWERRATKQSEMMIKPLPPMVEKINPAFMDAMAEYEKLVKNNQSTAGRTYEQEEQKYKQQTRGMIIR